MVLTAIIIVGSVDDVPLLSGELQELVDSGEEGLETHTHTQKKKL